MLALRRLLLSLISLVLVFGVTMSGSSANADTNVADLSADPTSTGYSPIAWAKAWSDKKIDYDELQQGEPEQYLKDSGLVRDGGQWDALTPEDRTQIEEQWPGGLLKKIWNLAADSVKTNHNASRQEGTWVAPEWTPANSDAVAQILGGDSYSSLSPGLKSIVERAAVIITGDSKPPMPDDQWASWMTPDERAAYDAAEATRYDWEQNYVVTGEPAEVVTKCKEDMPSILVAFCETVQAGVEAAGDVAESAAETVSFASDPLGWLNEKLAAGVTEIFGWLATLANESTLPDLTLDSWISMYQKGFAAGIVIFFLVLMWQFVRLSRGKISSAEMLDSLVARTPAYFAGVIFGPPAAQFLIVGAGQLTNGIVQGMTGPNGEATEAVTATVTAAGKGNILGGAFAALLVLLVLMVACFFIFITLCIQTITIYLSSVVFAIAFAWIADARRTNGSLKIPFLLMGIIFSRPLLFALLNFGLGFMGDSFTDASGDVGKTLTMLFMTIVLLSMIALTPVLLLQFAPVMPHGSDSTGGAGGASRSVPQSGMAYSGASSGASAMQGMARPSVSSGAASVAPASTGNSGGAAPASSASNLGAADGSGSPPRSGVSQAGTAKSGAESGSVGRMLGRTRRHGGGAPSAAASALLTGGKSGHGTGDGPGKSAAPAAGGSSSASTARGSSGGLGSRVRRGAQKAARPGAEAARNVGGTQPWQ